MDTFAKHLYQVLQQHAGHAQAITVDALQARVGGSARRIRHVIQQLVIAERLPIVSSVHPPMGYFLVTTEAEMRDCLRQYGARIRELRERMQVLQQLAQEQFGMDVQHTFVFTATEEAVDEPSDDTR